MSQDNPAPKLHCDKCDQFRPHRTVEGRDYCNHCNAQHPAPFTFGQLTPLQVSFCWLLRDEFLRGILTEYPAQRRIR